MFGEQEWKLYPRIQAQLEICFWLCMKKACEFHIISKCVIFTVAFLQIRTATWSILVKCWVIRTTVREINTIFPKDFDYEGGECCWALENLPQASNYFEIQVQNIWLTSNRHWPHPRCIQTDRNVSSQVLGGPKASKLKCMNWGWRIQAWTHMYPSMCVLVCFHLDLSVHLHRDIIIIILISKLLFLLTRSDHFLYWSQSPKSCSSFPPVST